MARRRRGADPVATQATFGGGEDSGAPGTLYLVGTPIGNLGDLSSRAGQTLAAVHLVVAEDTRRTRQLLSALGVHRPVRSFHEHSPDGRAQDLVGQLAAGRDVAYVTDAGMPAVADPGARLVRAAADAGVPVVVVPGPSAVTAAVALSGFGGDSFVFAGFVPRTPVARRRFWAEVAASRWMWVTFEVPHRVLSSLADAAAALGDRPVAVAREMTKVNEEVLRGSAEDVAAQLRARFGDTPRGEYVVVVGPAKQKAPPIPPAEVATPP